LNTQNRQYVITVFIGFDLNGLGLISMEPDYIALDRRTEPFVTPRLIACLAVFSCLLSAVLVALT
jgi:hypothetical protein